MMMAAVNIGSILEMVVQWFCLTDQQSLPRAFETLHRNRPSSAKRSNTWVVML